MSVYVLMGHVLSLSKQLKQRTAVKWFSNKILILALVTKTSTNGIKAQGKEAIHKYKLI